MSPIGSFKDIDTGYDTDEVPVDSEGGTRGTLGGTRRLWERREPEVGAGEMNSEADEAAALALGKWSRLERRGAASETSISVEIGSFGIVVRLELLYLFNHMYKNK